MTIGHITREELTAPLTQTDVMNGFANRFMMAHSARNKRVHEPQPTPPEVVFGFAHRIVEVVRLAVERGAQPVPRGEVARRRWIELSDELEQRGMFESKCAVTWLVWGATDTAAEKRESWVISRKFSPTRTQSPDSPNPDTETKNPPVVRWKTRSKIRAPRPC